MKFGSSTVNSSINANNTLGIQDNIENRLSTRQVVSSCAIKCAEAQRKYAFHVTTTQSDISKARVSRIVECHGYQDDLYLHAFAMNARNEIAVGLRSAVNIWYPNKAAVRLCEKENTSNVTSVAWNADGTLVAVGDSKGALEIWETATASRLSAIEWVLE